MDGLLVCQALRHDPATAAIPDHHADGARRGVRPHPRPRTRRRRLRRQAVQPEGTRRARRGAAAARRATADAAERRSRYGPLTIDLERHQVRVGDARSPAHGQGIPAAAVPARASRPGAVARSAADRRLGLSVHGRHAHRGRARAPPPREDSAAGDRASRRSSSSATNSTTRPPRRDLPHADVPRRLHRDGAGARGVDLAGRAVAARVPVRRHRTRPAQSGAARRRAAGRPRAAGRSGRRGRRAGRARRRARDASSPATARCSAIPRCSPAHWPTLENHATREEVVAARDRGEGTSSRHSHTTSVDTMYAAVARPRRPGRVRARGAAAHDDRRADRRRAPAGAGRTRRPASGWRCVADRHRRRCCSTGASAAWRRPRGAIRTATSAGRHATTAATRSASSPTCSTTRRATLGTRLAEMARERAHMDAILTGMVEGVVLVNARGQLVLTNPAVRVDAAAAGLRRGRGTTSRSCGSRTSRRSWPRRSPARRQPRVEVQLDRDARRRSSPTSCPSRASAAAAPCSCCTTSRTCGTPIRSGAISSPTSRTNCGRR